MPAPVVRAPAPARVNPVVYVPKITTAQAGKQAAVIVTTVIVFIFAFASASSWILFVTRALPAIYTRTDQEMFNVKAFGLFALVLTLVTIGLALAFGFATKDTKVKVPLDFNTLLKNVQSDTSNNGPHHRIYIDNPASLIHFLAPAPLPAVEVVHSLPQKHVPKP